MTEAAAPVAPAPKRYRLLARAQINGAVREAGYIFTLAAGEIGPMRTVLASQHGAQLVDHLAQQNEMSDVPLYEEVVDKPAAPPTAAKPSYDDLDKALAAANGEIATLKAQMADKDRQLGEAHAKLAAVDAAVKSAVTAAKPAIAAADAQS